MRGFLGQRCLAWRKAGFLALQCRSSLRWQFVAAVAG
jgi:hypothetical protein